VVELRLARADLLLLHLLMLELTAHQLVKWPCTPGLRQQGTPALFHFVLAALNAVLGVMSLLVLVRVQVALVARFACRLDMLEAKASQPLVVVSS
jgi:hypothetical protein